MIKKVLVIITFISFISTVLATTEIATCADLQKISLNLREDYYLSGNIDCNNQQIFPIGTSANPFTGTLDGHGYSISNLHIARYPPVESTNFPPNDQGDSLGLFAHTAPTAKIARISIISSLVEGNQEVGTLVGYNKGEIVNCSVIGDSNLDPIVATADKGVYQASGGLVGINEGKIINCHVSNAKIDVYGGQYGGGLAGFNYGEIKDSSFSGTLDLKSLYLYDSYYGGLVGGSYSGKIENSNTSGTIIGSGNYVGGLVGRCFTECYIEQSFSKISITNSGITSTAGGLVGQNSGTILNSYARGNIDISGNQAGGLVGIFSEGAISRSYSTGSINSGSIPRGGLVGRRQAGSTFSSYWDKDSSGQTFSPAGTSYDTLRIQNVSNLIAWDLLTVWENDSNMINNGYPILQWENESCNPDGCNANCPRGCSPVSDIDCDFQNSCCGDGICGPKEDIASCATDCESICGNNVLEPGEECDVTTPACVNVPYGQSCNYCSNTCENITISGGSCGNGVLETPQETCDNGPENTDMPCKPPVGSDSCDHCTTSCELKTLEYTSMYWMDVSGGLIQDASTSGTVAMIYWIEDPAMSLNKPTAFFEIFESDEGVFNPDEAIRTGLSAIEGEYHQFTDGWAIVGYWTISENDLNLAGSDFDDFVFKMKVEGYPDLGQSKTLTLDDSIPSEFGVILEQPYCGRFYEVGDTMNVVIPQSSLDDIISGTIMIGGDLFTFNNYGKIFQYPLTTAGNLEIILSASNSRGESTTQKRTVIVADPSNPSTQTYVAACINEPADISAGVEKGTVKFSADATRAVEYTPTTGFTDISPNRLRFHWKFSDGRTNPFTSGDHPLSQTFYKNFANPGGGWANLDVEVI